MLCVHCRNYFLCIVHLDLSLELRFSLILSSLNKFELVFEVESKHVSDLSITKLLKEKCLFQVHRMMMSKERDELYCPMEKHHIVKILENGQVTFN